MAEPHVPLGEGAGQAAPTAPHATPRRDKGRPTGPERFWAKGSSRWALALAILASGVVHGSMVPIRLGDSIDVQDYEGQAAIPLDLFEQREPAQHVPPAPALPPEPAPSHAESSAQEDGGTAPPRTSRDAGSARDAGALEDAGEREQAEDAALADASPQALLASSHAVQADVVFVTVVINAIEIRKNPAAAELGGVLRAIPQWNDFMQGTEGLIDPVRDTDWILISGPSLRDSSHDAVTIRYATSDAKVDQAMAIVSQRYARGGPYDAGVPGVRAWLARADYAERVIERPRQHVLVIVPPRQAAAVARQLAKAGPMVQNIMPGVATFVRVLDPHHALPGLIPEGIVEMRLKVIARADAGADVDIEGDCKDERTCARAVPEVMGNVRARNSALVSLATGGLLDGVEAAAHGTRLHVHLAVSREQLAATMHTVELILPSLTPPPAETPGLAGAHSP